MAKSDVFKVKYLTRLEAMGKLANNCAKFFFVHVALHLIYEHATENEVGPIPRRAMVDASVKRTGGDTDVQLKPRVEAYERLATKTLPHRLGDSS
ncbi:MAG: hypothetical protein DHS20C16_14620 [Phycisphaerae bacterium]|nr:MAG: hypothetical protein DHS20C16_14620 [Phycisphaerae bacterium]